jgi:hypothetical protein
MMDTMKVVVAGVPLLAALLVVQVETTVSSFLGVRWGPNWRIRMIGYFDGVCF